MGQLSIDFEISVREAFTRSTDVKTGEQSSHKR
jgi:hypothetical protein